MKTAFYIEYFGEQVSREGLVEEAKKIWADSGKKPEDLKSIKIYVKVEEDRAYYIFNGNEAGSFHIVDVQNDF